MTYIELLSPAKDLECGIAAIDHGADAVYIGAKRFGARAAAGNSIEDIAQLCNYAHQFGAKVYVTVNTIIYDDELEDTRLLINELRQAGADAILVQDMALFDIASASVLHASTQTDNRTAEKVRWLASLGARRVVLARELSATEIADIHRQVPDVELEAFVHGALCVSYSGLCYASQHCFNRSANRGECAQFCRMKFDLIDADGQVLQHDRYLLSLKDMNQSQQLAKLIEAGVTSLKIEGRLKDLTYVKNVTAAYSQLLNKYISQHSDRYARASLGHCTYTFTPNLDKTFNRGYTNYFLNGRQSGIASFDTPKAIGEFVGTVKEIRHNSFTVAGTVAFSNGDGLCFLAQSSSTTSQELQGFRINRAEGNRLFPLKMPAGLHPDMRLYRNNDQEMERILAKQSAERKIPVNMSLQATDTGFALTMSLAGTVNAQQITVAINAKHQKAQTSQRENIVRQLTKLGGTIYVCKDVGLPAGFDFFIPSSILADLRRKATTLAVTSFTGNMSQPAPHTHNDQPAAPTYALPYLYNVSNRLARKFYTDKGIRTAPAFETKEPDGEAVIMQCRHCLRYALGHCVKHGGKAPAWREPLFLRLGDGRQFRLQFDCKHCQMNVIGVEGGVRRVE